ncbi:MAG: response regulator [Halioglobus sp.]|nr:response regulator [Halioglobus sp.]
MNTEMLGGTEAVDPAADSRESELGWLLDMDLSEPQEKLFTVEQATSVDTSLTEYELEVARRPMTRGAAGADDLASYVDEEIVISSEAQGSDIYASTSQVSSGRNSRESDELMAIDFSRPSRADAADPQSALKEGQDILGLVDQDDIGQKFLAIKRPKYTPGGELDNGAPGTGAGANATVDEVAPLPTMLSEAPVLRLVMARAPLPVANDPATDNVAARVAGLLPALMDQLRVAVNERLAVLGLAADSVRVELKMARDQSHADELSTQGFGPLIAICSSPLGTLQQLRQYDVDALYLRLLDAGDGQSRNKLFEENQVSTAPAADHLECESPLEQLETFLADMATDMAMPAEEVVPTGELAESCARQWQPEDADIDDVFADFGGPGDTATGDEFIADPAASALAEFLDADSCDIFAEDFFADENLPGFGVVADTAVIAASPQADIDELFESLGIEPVEADEICGVGVGEFSAAAGYLQLVPPLETGSTAQSVAGPEAADGAEFCCVPGGIVFAEASLGGGEIFSDFLDAFVEEGSSELEKLEDAVARWEKDLASEAAYAAVSRILHTIKGIAKGVGLQFYGTLIHNFETLLSALPRPRVGSEGEYFRIVNAWLDACVRGLDHIQDSRADIPNTLPQGARPEPVEAPVSAPQAAEAALAPAVPAPQPVSEASDARARQLSKKMADEGARALAAQQSVRITSEKLDHLLNLSNQAQQLSVRTAQSVTRSKRSSSEMQSRLASVRAHITAIADRALRSVAAKGVQPGAPMDALEMDQYSELQEAANILREGVEDLADLVDFATRQNIQVEALLKQQTRVISSIGSAIRNARVVPVSRLIPGLRRLVRTLSVDLDKTVSFQVLNELGTLDRDDYARCQTILDHMVRNALDHGIEHADERVAAGKPAEGLVTIDIRKAGADSVITLTDDGRGIDPEKMRESAIRKGLDLDVYALTDAEATRLIFHKGFSTASSISQISGRGVGMDIVLTELQEMGGDIQINSVPGRGTSFHIRVPSSVTVNGALLVSAGEYSYAIPLGGLIAVEQVPVAEFFAAVQDNTRLTVSGMECEPAYLATLCHTGHALDAKTWRTSVPVIVAGSPERYMAIAIDDVEEALELVIRSLGPQFSTVPGVAGAATTAAGEAIVALDLNLLVASVPADGRSTLHVDAPREENLLVMVVDDSRTQRMVATSQLETLGVETITAENGAVAIDLLNTAERLPDIILMDVEMPVKDGIQALREIRKSVRFGHIPVIMITSRTGLKHRAMAQAAGCNGYMGKPFNFRMLIGQVNELTGYRLQLS